MVSFGRSVHHPHRQPHPYRSYLQNDANGVINPNVTPEGKGPIAAFFDDVDKAIQNLTAISSLSVICLHHHQRQRRQVGHDFFGCFLRLLPKAWSTGLTGIATFVAASELQAVTPRRSSAAFQNRQDCTHTIQSRRVTTSANSWAAQSLLTADAESSFVRRRRGRKEAL